MVKTCMVTEILHNSGAVMVDGKVYSLPVKLGDFIWALMSEPETNETCIMSFIVEDYEVTITEFGHVLFSMPIVTYCGKHTEVTKISLDSAFYRDEIEAQDVMNKGCGGRENC